MKTFTNYAEKKAKQILNLLQGYTKGIRLTAILILLLMGVNNAWAGPSFSGGYVYFHNKGGWNDSYKYLCIGKSSYTELRSMSVVTNTQLWRNSLPTSGWGDATYMAVIGTSGSWNSGKWGTSNLTNATHRTKSVSLGNWEFKSGHYQMLIPASGSNDATLELTWVGDDISSMNKTITVKAKVSTDGGSTYAEATSPGTLSASSYKFTTYSSCASATSLSSGTITCGYTANTTLTAANATGYTFVGWYDSAGTQQETENTYTLSINPTADATYYAYYKKNQHTVLFGVHSSGHGSLTAKVGSTSITSGNKVNYGSEVVFTATPSTGYQIEGWYSNSACTTPINNGTNNTYTVTLTANKTVYVKFEAIPANSHNITYTAEGTGWTYGNSNPTTAEEGATVTFVVNPTAGYRVSVSSDGPALTGPNANNQYTFTMPTKDVKITVEAKPEQYTVTLNKQSGTGGTSSVTATYLAAMPSITAPTRTGYTFNGYFDATSGGTKYYNANGSSAKNWDKTSNTTLYAQWTANQYTITYKDQNNADFSGTHASGHPTTHTYGTATTLKDATKTGYTFDGWFTTSACTGTAITSLEATDYTSNITLYAKWTELPPTTVYFKPIDDWKGDNTRFAVYYWEGNTNGWIDMIEEGCTGEFYKADIPAGFTNIKFVSFPTDKENNWDYDIKRTEDLKVPNDGKVLYDMASITQLYLQPNDKWKQTGARFAAYFFKQGDDNFGNKWMSMSDSDSDGIYNCSIPTDKAYPNVIFCRMNGGNSTNNWDNKWNQTGDLTIPTDGKNLFDKPNDTWDGATTSWSTIYDNSKWTTYTVPTYTININAPEAGSIAVTVGGNTTTVTNTPKQITNIAAGTTFTIEYTPNAGFELGHSEVEGIKEAYDGAGTYTVCGPVDITAHFVTEEDQVVYLRPNGTWLSDNAIFYAYVFNRYGDDEWIELTTKETDYTGAYGCTIPAGYYSDVIFVRINPTADEPSWDDGVKWNQSVDYVIPVNTTTNRFIIGEKITAEGADKDKYQGSWEASDTPIYGIPGDWQGTDTWAADEYPLMGPDGLVTVNITQTNDTLGFKVYRYPYGTDEESRKWLGNNGTMVRGGEAVHEGGWTMETNTNNCGLAVDVAGDYVFHFNIRESKLTVQYPPMPVPSNITLSAQRVFEDAPLDWFAGDGTEANPYLLYADEAARITVSSLPEVEGLTAYYQFGNNEEQTSNVFDWKYISSQATTMEVKAYYKNAMGAKSAEATVNTSYFKTLALPFYLMTQPKDEINIDRIAAGANITVQFRSDSKATVDLYLNDTDGTPLTTITNKDSYDFEYDVPDDIEPCILTFIAKAQGAGLHGRIFEVKADVVIYKNVIIKVNDPEGWVKNVYMWRDYSDAVLTPWPGDPVLQNYGTWRVFSVKYPYYDHFIINDGNSGGSTQTLDWELPADDTCYELLDPANNGSDKAEDKGKYGLKVADCPGNLIVSDIKDTTIMEGEQIVVMPEIFVGLGYKLSDVRITQLNANNPSSVRADISGTNIIILGYGIGESNVDVTYTLGNETITKTFTVYVVKNTNITIQVKVPDFGDGSEYQWTDGSKYGIRYWGKDIDGTDLIMDYAYTDGTYMYAQAQIPLGTDGTINFHFYYERHGDDNAKWRQTTNIENVSTSGCYKLKQGNDYYRHWERTDDYCFDDEDYAQYQVKIFMPTLGKEYYSNIVTNTTDTLSFFAPGENETGYRAGNVQLYKNKKMIASIPANNFPESNVYIATIAETGDGLTNVTPYSGNFYIRTYGTSHATIGFNNGKGWNSIKDLTAVEKDSVRFTYFISRKGEFYNHYWVQDMNTGGYDGKNVSACVANDYNDDLAGKLTKGKGTDESGDIKVGSGKVINVRFGYDPRTNYFGRAIIKGSEYDNYLNIHCDNAYKDKNCSTKLPYGTSGLENKMQDISNWVYQRDFYVPITNSYPSASLYVEATSPSTEMTVTDHLLGYVINEITGEETTTPVQRTVIGSGTNNGTYLMRVVYDFKTNRIIAAWLPQGTIEVTDDRTLNADVLFVRNENNDVPQIQLANEGKIRSLESMYFALELERGDKNAANRHEEQYFFTLPFNSIVGSISGVPGYMQTWGIQRYRGDLRAQKGWFIETPTFWEWMSLTDTLYAGEGYALVFDKKAAAWNEIEVDKTDAEGNIMYETNQEGDTIYENGAPKALKDTISMMRLYFPSDTSGFNMQQQSAEHLIRTYPNHPCTITREERDKQDSNWKVIGTTSYNNAGIKEYVEDTDPEYEELNGNTPPNFRYAYEYTMSNDNKTFSYTYTPEDGKTNTYKSFFGYMVQFAGTITWQPIMSETVPEGIAARRRVAEGERTSYTTRLELANANGEKQDQAFVALDEKATTTFDQNKDLNKIINAGKANIYTLSENIPFAGNTLPIAKATVPVGVVITETGEYTFRMPDGTDGIAVTLVDNVTGTHTNMLMNEYTVTLNAGTIENRFYLVVDPDRTATSVENVGSGANGDEAKGQIKKFLIDGKLFIRTTDGIFDAKGQRL